MPVLQLDGNASGAVKAAADVATSVDKIKTSFAAAAREAQQMELAAKRIVQENEGPQEKYNRKVDELSKLFVAGKLNVEQMDRALVNYRGQLDQATGAHKGHKEAHQESFGAASLNELLGFAAGMVTVGKGIEFVTDAMRKQAEEKAKAAEDVAGGLGGADALVNSGNPARARAIQLQLLSSGLIAGDQQALAAQVAGGIVKGGAGGESDTEFLQGLGEKRVVQPAQLGDLAQNIARAQQAYQGKAGSFQDLGKQLVTAGSDTLGLSSPAEIGKTFADIAKDAMDAGQSPQQTLARLTTFIRQTKSGKAGEAAMKKQLESGDDFEGDQAAVYAQELQKIQGAPQGTIPDFIATDPQLSSARGAEKAKGRLGTSRGSHLAEREAIWNEMTAERDTYAVEHGWSPIRRAVASGAYGLEHFLSGEDDEFKKTLASPEKSSVYERETLARMERWLATQTQLMQQDSRQTPPPSGRQE